MRIRIILPFFHYRKPVDPRVETGAWMTGGGGACAVLLPFDHFTCVCTSACAVLVPSLMNAGALTVLTPSVPNAYPSLLAPPKSKRTHGSS
ncbi:MAG: hypothetical protein ACXVDN_22530, partial [Ktedonobacteraceae bacterium]